MTSIPKNLFVISWTSVTRTCILLTKQSGILTTIMFLSFAKREWRLLRIATERKAQQDLVFSKGNGLRVGRLIYQMWRLERKCDLFFFRSTSGETLCKQFLEAICQCVHLEVFNRYTNTSTSRKDNYLHASLSFFGRPESVNKCDENNRNCKGHRKFFMHFIYRWNNEHFLFVTQYDLRDDL